MTLTVDLEPEIAAHLRAEAARAGVTLEQLAVQRLLEADLLWRIRTSVPEVETRELHRLLRRSRAGRLTEQDRARLSALLDEREERAVRRLQDLAQLARWRAIPVRRLMDQLGIRPLPAP